MYYLRIVDGLITIKIDFFCKVIKGEHWQRYWQRLILLFLSSQCNTCFLHEASDVKSSRWPASKLNKKSTYNQSCPNMNEPFPLIWINVIQPNPKESLISQWKQIVSDIKRWNENVLSPRIQMTLCAAVETSTSKESTAAVTVKNLMMPVKGQRSTI